VAYLEPLNKNKGCW